MHGHGSYAYADYLQWPHDPNLTMNVLIEVLQCRFMDLIGSCQQLPKKLYLQLDNCMRENKNRHVLGFLSLLVQEKIFEEVSKSLDKNCHNIILYTLIGGTRIFNGGPHT